MQEAREKCWLLGALMLLPLMGCSHMSPISQDVQHRANKDLTLADVQANPSGYQGALVVWGGAILETRNLQKGSEIIVLQLPLSSREKPKDKLRESQGRFIAKSAQFLDPEIYREHRRITVAGTVAGQEQRAIGQATYSYPVINMVQSHVWREQPPAYAWNYPYYWGYPYYMYGPLWYDPLWYDPLWYGTYQRMSFDEDEDDDTRWPY